MSDTAAEIVSDIVSNEPRVNEAVVQALNDERSQETETSGSVSTDNPSSTTPTDNGPVFDPSIHETNPDGTPRLTKDGKPRRKRGTKPKNGYQGHTQQQPQPGQVEGLKASDFKQSAGLVAGMMFMAGQAVFGPAWKPADEEKIAIEDAFARYFEAKGFDDIPPGLALIMAIGVYAGPRLAMDETTHERLRAMGIMRAKPKKVENTAPQQQPQQPQQQPPPPPPKPFSSL